jgi:hypothetical protein
MQTSVPDRVEAGPATVMPLIAGSDQHIYADDIRTTDARMLVGAPVHLGSPDPNPRVSCCERKIHPRYPPWLGDTASTLSHPLRFRASGFPSPCLTSALFNILAGVGSFLSVVTMVPFTPSRL